MARTELTSTLGRLEVQLERTLTERGALARQLGDVAAIKDERDGLANAIETIRREHVRLLDELVETGSTPGRYGRSTPSSGPIRPSDSRRWDRAARVLSHAAESSTSKPATATRSAREHRVASAHGSRALRAPTDREGAGVPPMLKAPR